MTGIGGPTRSDRSDLEDRLRDAFSDARRVELSAGFFDGWPEALPSRPRISRRVPVPAAAAVAVAACLVVAAALALHPSTVPLGASPSPSEGSSSSLGPGSTASIGPSLPAGVIAWIDTTPMPSPSPTPTPTIAGLPTCSAATLEMRFGGWAGLTGGTLDGGVSIAQPDPGAARCVVSGVPSVSLLDADGRKMSIDIRPIPSPDASLVVIEPGLPLPPEHTALLVGQAWFDFTWANWCGSNPGKVGTLVVHLPGAGVRSLPIQLDPPPCITQGARSEMGVDPLAPAEGAAPEASPPAWSELTADVLAPSMAVAGQPYRYLVTLRNTTGHGIALDPCLTYVERLWSGSTTVAAPTYVLNCGPVGAIASGGSATFEMVLEVPVDAPPGPAVFLWSTDGPSGPKLPLTIAPAGSAIGSVAPATVPPSRDQLDLVDAKRVSTAFETARAGGDWQAAWQLLSPFSQAKIGSIDAFIHAQTTFNLQGGSTFVVAEPSKDGDLLAPAFLGNDLFGNLKGNAQLERAWFVGVTHPDVSGASGGSEDLVVAPLIDGTWRVWVR